jgi:exopolysaccharide biosynthesis polyprenyl glycosylphosphotransferase
MADFAPRDAVRRSDVIRVCGLVLVDVFALYEAFVLAYIQRASDAKPLAFHESAYGFGVRAAIVAPLWVVVFATCGLYAARLDHHRVSETTRVVVAVAGGVMTLIVWDYLSPNSPLFPSRSVPVWAILFGVVFVLTCRALLRRAMHACFGRGLGLHNVILVGSGALAGRIAQEMAHPRNGYRIVAVVDTGHDAGQVPGVPSFASLEAAVAADSRRIDEIMQADSELGRIEITRMMTYANERGINYRFVPDQYGVYAAASSIAVVGGIPVFELRLTALDGWGAVGKRAFDIVASVLAIIVLSPVLLAVSIAVKFSDPSGPVFYRQERLGKNGRPIRVLKFRSMSSSYATGPGMPFADPEAALTAMGRLDLVEEFTRTHKVSDDPRVSPVGGFLRRTSLDELPQLLNALRGELSLVGPRPITRTELDRYGAQGASFMALKPGITGLWQVSGRSEVTYTERVRLDVFYVENWSVSLDLSILFRTVRTVGARRGAY